MAAWQRMGARGGYVKRPTTLTNLRMSDRFLYNRHLIGSLILTLVYRWWSVVQVFHLDAGNLNDVDDVCSVGTVS